MTSVQATSDPEQRGLVPAGAVGLSGREYTSQSGRFSARAKLPAAVLAGVVVAGLSLGAVWLFDGTTESMPYSLQTTPRSQAEILEACDGHVRAAKVEARTAVDRRAAEFASFVEERKAGVPEFAREIVSWRSKWRLFKQWLSFTDPDGHRKYVEEQFAEHVFSEADLASVTRLAVTGSLKDLEGIENKLAGRLQSEIVGRPVHVAEAAAAEKQFSLAIEQLVSASQWDAAKTAGNLAISEAAATVGTQVLVRMGVSAGLLSTGAATSWWTLGGGLLLGLAVDAVWQWIDDPAGDIERETLAALDKLAADGSAALRDELGEQVTARVGLWNRVVEEMVP